MRWLLVTGTALVAAGVVLHVLGINPVVKRIWTPAWTLFSGGLCYLLLASFSWVIDIKGYRRWAFPLIVIGLNSIAAYVIAHLWESFIATSFKTHLGQGIFETFGTGTGAVRRRCRGALGLLARPVLDVPATAVPQDLTVVRPSSIGRFDTLACAVRAAAVLRQTSSVKRHYPPPHSRPESEPVTDQQRTGGE